MDEVYFFITEHTCIMHINFSNCGIKDQAILAEMISRNETLAALHLTEFIQNDEILDAI